MQRFFLVKILFFAIFVIISAGLLSSNSERGLTWAGEEQVQNEENEDSHVEDIPTQHRPKNVVTLTNTAKANIGLKTVEADVQTIEKVVEVTGNIIAHPGKQAIVTPRIGGIVKRVNFNLGDTVKEGDVLIELESLDLQFAEIDLIEAVNQQKSLDSKLAKQKSVFAKQIRLELQTRQINYLESITELQEQKKAYEKYRSIAIAKTISTLEQMRVDFVKANVESKLLENTLARIESLTEIHVSSQKELAAKQAEYSKASNALIGVKRQFQLLGVNEKILEKILIDDGTTPILTLLNSDEKNQSKRKSNLKTPINTEHPALHYISLIEEAAELVDSELAYRSAAIKFESNKQRSLIAGLTASQLDTLTETASVISFEDVPSDTLIDKFAPFMTSSETLEALFVTEEGQRNAEIVLTKVRQQLKVYGMTSEEINQIVQTGMYRSLFLVTAPTSGQIIHQDVTLGATVEKSDSLFSILDTSIVLVEGEAYENTLSLLSEKWQTGGEVRIRVPAYLGTIFIGKISQISAVVDSQKRTVHFWTEVNNTDRQLKPGMFAEQTLVIEKLDDVLSVPLSAVLEDGATKFVFVESGNTYIKHEVELGAKDDRYIEIKDGLFAGELVVIQGTHQLMSASADTAEVVDPHARHSH